MNPLIECIDKLSEATGKMEFLADAVVTILRDPHNEHQKNCDWAGAVIWPVIREFKDCLKLLNKIHDQTNTPPTDGTPFLRN